MGLTDGRTVLSYWVESSGGPVGGKLREKKCFTSSDGWYAAVIVLALNLDVLFDILFFECPVCGFRLQVFFFR